MTFHRCHIGISIGSASTDSRCDSSSDKVVVITSIPVDGQINSVVEKTKVSADIQLMFLFVGQFAVFAVRHINTRLLNVCKRAIRRICPENSL